MTHKFLDLNGFSKLEKSLWSTTEVVLLDDNTYQKFQHRRMCRTPTQHTHTSFDDVMLKVSLHHMRLLSVS